MIGVFDIGGSNIRMGVSTNGEQLDNTVIIHTPQDFEEGLQAIFTHLQQLAGGEKITAVAGGIAGPLNKEKTSLVHTSYLPQWVEKSLVKRLSTLFDCSVVLENDAALGGLGEAVYGAGKDAEIVAYIAIGTGVGGSLIVHKKIAPNAHGFEPGHQIIVANGREDTCGPFGHLEAYIGGLQIKKLYGKAPEDITDPVWSEIASFLSIGLNNTVVHWSPDVVVVAGSVGVHIPLNEVQQSLDTKLLKVFPHKPLLVTEKLGKLSGLYGAVAYLQSQA